MEPRLRPRRHSHAGRGGEEAVARREEDAPRSRQRRVHQEGLGLEERVSGDLNYL